MGKKVDNSENNWQLLLREPDISPWIPSADVYRAACIGAVTLLYEAGNCGDLMEMALYASAPESRARALAALESLTRGSENVRCDAIHCLYELAVLNGHRQAAAFLQKSGLQDKDPGWNSAIMLLFEQKHLLLKADPELENLTGLFLSGNEAMRLRLLLLGEKVLPNWTLLMRFLDDPSDLNRQAVLDGYKGFSPVERALVSNCAERPGISSASLPADLLLRYEDEFLRELCIRNDLHPSDRSQEALFYFLSGQWERYYQSDSNYRSIRIAYEKKDADIQRRLIAVSRDSGNNSWLQFISGDVNSVPHGAALSDQHLLVDSLIRQKQWTRLWDILPNVPLLCMPAVCRALDEAGQKPSRIEEMSFLKELRERIAASEGSSPIPLSRQFRGPGGTAIGLSGGGNRFAVLFSDRRVLVWDIREPESDPVCISSNQLPFRRIMLSNDGKYLCTDCGSGILTVFSLSSGQVVKTLRNDGSAFAGFFLQADGRRLILLGQNGKGLVFSFPGGAELSRFDIGLKECFRSAYDPQMNRLCGISPDGNCVVYDIPENRVITGIKLEAAATPDCFSRGKLSFIDTRETLSRINLLSGKLISESPDCGPDKIRRMLELNDGDLYLLGTLSGQISVFDPTTGRIHALLDLAAKSAVTGMWYSSEDAMLYACSANGIVRGWDFGLFRDMCHVLPLTRLPGIGRIDEFRKKYPEPGVKAAAEWLKTVVAWRRRFDIEIDFDD